jgi:hypothetical protein
MSRTSYTIQVQKANVPLLKGESITAFTRALNEEAKKHLMQSFNIEKNKGGAFPLEVFSDKAVFSVIPVWEDVSKDETVAFTFKRDASTGAFEFGQAQKVKKVTSYEVTKSADGVKVGASTEPIEVQKSFWDGVL